MERGTRGFLSVKKRRGICEKKEKRENPPGYSGEGFCQGKSTVVKERLFTGGAIF